MPKTEKFFFTANIVWSLLALSAVAHNQLFVEVRLLHVSIIHSVTAAVMLMAAIILWVRYLPAIAILRILIYTVMLAQGALIIYSIDEFLSWPGFVTLVSTLIFIFYMFGFRVYLTSTDGKHYFLAE